MITIEEVYNRINGIRDDLIFDTEVPPTAKELDEIRQKAALELEGLAMEIRESMENKI